MSDSKPIGHPHGPMRRKEREITDRAEIDEILRTSKIMHIALSDHDVPFLVPVYFTYTGTAIYFHSSRKGTKMDILTRNNRVCFEVSQEDGVIEADFACDFEAKHRTVIGLGRATLVDDLAEKAGALNRIVALFTDKKFEFPAANLNATAVVRIDIDSIKGKKHGFA